MPIPSIFIEGTDWKSLESEIRSFGATDSLTEGDLVALLQTIDMWRERFTEPFTIEHGGELITWYRYELLVWALGEEFRRVMLRLRRFRRDGRVFEAVQTVCLDRRFGKGRESFTMLLGQYGYEF